MTTDLGLTHEYRGKVRDLYRVDDDTLLMVASDRLSAFDVVMAEPIPDKGRVLTGLTNFWLNEFGPAVPSSLLSCDPTVIDGVVPGFAEASDLHGRTMLVRRAEMVQLECIVRGRLAGSAYEEYRRSGTIFGLVAPEGMELTDEFPEPLFTPSTKATEGHDEYISMDRAAQIAGADTVVAAEAMCKELFARAAARLDEVGLVLADTKFELGYLDGQLVVCDEVLTPDSSRIWLKGELRRGETPSSFDKQPFRDWLAASGWDRQPPPPPVPDDVVAITAARYRECYDRVTGRPLGDWYGH